MCFGGKGGGGASRIEGERRTSGAGPEAQAAKGKLRAESWGGSPAYGVEAQLLRFQLSARDS